MTETLQNTQAEGQVTKHSPVPSANSRLSHKRHQHHTADHMLNPEFGELEIIQKRLLRTVDVLSPAKINLTLKVDPGHGCLRERHKLDTIYCGIGIYDTISVHATTPGSGCSLHIQGDHLGDLGDRPHTIDKQTQENDCVRALLALAQASGRAPDVELRVNKHIPVAAGLAGGSTDAAGTLLALNALWGLNWSLKDLDVLAQDLGSDVPFCLYGGYAHGLGFGQEVTPLHHSSPLMQRFASAELGGHILVGAYEQGLSTPKVYARFDRVGPGEQELNDLQKAAVQLHPRSGLAIRAALAAGAQKALVAGSGPSVIAFVNEAEAKAVSGLWMASGTIDRVIDAKAPAYPIIRVGSVRQ